MAYRPCAMIFIADPETSTAPDTVYLQRQFKLTPAEAALTQELLQGDGIAAAADRIGIAVATARAQLRSVLAKTGTGRQAELVRLVLNSLNRLRKDG
jgi:DNA-binding CsgD family transcriptional regulator